MQTVTEKKKAPRERGEGGLFRLGNSKAWYTKVLGKRESTGTKVKEEAKKVLAARMGRAVLGLPDPTALRNLKYEEARERLLADYRQKAHSSLKKLKNGKVTIDGLPYVDKFFGGRSLVDIHRAMLDKFVEQRQRDGASNAYINRNLALLHRAMKLLSEDKNGALFVPKFPKLKEARARQGFCEPERFAKLLVVLPERLKTFALFLYTVGCRCGEAKKLEWSQVDWPVRLIRVHEDQTKNREARTIPLAPVVFDRLKRVPERDRHGRIFNVGNFRKAWHTACVKAGLGKLTKGKINDGYGKYEGLLIHDLRRSAVRNLREEGISEGVAMSVSGHKTREVFERYNIIIDEDKTAAVAKVGSKLTKVLVPKNGSSSGQVGRFSRRRKARIASVHADFGRSSNW